MDALEFPSWIAWGQRKGAILKQPPGRGPNGRRLCRWCAGEVPPRASTWCSEACVAMYKRVWTWEAVRRYVIARDKQCQRCGTPHPGWKGKDAWPGQNWCYLEPWPWEVDHIHRITDGGTDDPANLRLACHNCHVAIGYEQRAAAKARRAA